jgi:hypothetical protein
MKKHVLIMLMTVCCWIFLVSGNVYSGHHGGGGGHHGYHHRGHHGGYYVGGGGYAWQPGGFFWSNAAVEGYTCVWNGYKYKCYRN